MFRSRIRSAAHGTELPRGTRAPRQVIVVALAAFLVLAGPGAAWALWTATTSTATTATAARVLVTQQVTGLDTIYSAGYSGTNTVTGSVTVSNTGSVPGTATVTASAVGDLAGVVSVKVWQGTCALVPAGLAASTWASLPPLTSSIGPGASASWCVQSALDQFPALQHWGKSVSVSLATTLATGTSWTATAPTVGLTQSAGTATASDPRPTPPQLTVCTTPNNGQRLNLAWTAVDAPASYSIQVTGPVPGVTKVIDLLAVTSPIELTKQEMGNHGATAGTYRITVYADGTAIAADQFTYSANGDLACR